VQEIRKISGQLVPTGENLSYYKRNQSLSLSGYKRTGGSDATMEGNRKKTNRARSEGYIDETKEPTTESPAGQAETRNDEA